MRRYLLSSCNVFNHIDGACGPNLSRGGGPTALNRFEVRTPWFLTSTGIVWKFLSALPQHQSNITCVHISTLSNGNTAPVGSKGSAVQKLRAKLRRWPLSALSRPSCLPTVPDQRRVPSIRFHPLVPCVSQSEWRPSPASATACTYLLSVRRECPYLSPPRGGERGGRHSRQTRDMCACRRPGHDRDEVAFHLRGNPSRPEELRNGVPLCLTFPVFFQNSPRGSFRHDEAVPEHALARRRGDRGLARDGGLGPCRYRQRGDDRLQSQGYCCADRPVAHQRRHAQLSQARRCEDQGRRLQAAQGAHRCQDR